MLIYFPQFKLPKPKTRLLGWVFQGIPRNTTMWLARTHYHVASWGFFCAQAPPDPASFHCAYDSEIYMYLVI